MFSIVEKIMSIKLPRKFSDNNNFNRELDNFFQILEFLIVSNLDCASQKTAKDGGLVIAIDAEWGSGKTIFLEMLEQRVLHPSNEDREPEHIYSYKFQKLDFVASGDMNKMWQATIDKDKNKKVRIIKYNAWENDYFDDPFMSLVGQFCAQIPEANKDKLKTFKDKVITIGKSMVPLTLKVASAVSSALGEHVTKGCIEATKTTIDEGINIYKNLSKKIFSEQLEQFISSTASRDSFKNALCELSINDGNEEIINLFLIDELDRCKPKFAINLLETLKHFFNVPNAVFLVTLDKTVLTEHIKHYHGNIDGDRYLSRLFDFELKLPTDSAYFYEKLTEQFHRDIKNHLSLLPEIRKFFKFTPRDWTKYLINLGHLAKIPTWNRPETYLLLAIKMYNKEAYKYLCELNLTKDSQSVTDEELRNDLLIRINGKYSRSKEDEIMGNDFKSAFYNLFTSVLYCNGRLESKEPPLNRFQLIAIIRTIEHMF
jgi:hypothetical protein